MAEQRWATFFETPLGRMVRGIIKLALAGLLIQLVATISNALGPDPAIGETVIPVRLIFTLLTSFFPILLFISALHDLGVRL